MTLQEAQLLAENAPTQALAAFLHDVNNGESANIAAQLLNARILYHDEYRTNSQERLDRPVRGPLQG